MEAKVITGEHAIRVAARDGLQLIDVYKDNRPLDEFLAGGLMKYDDPHRVGVKVRFSGRYIDEAGKRVRKEHREPEQYFRGWRYLGPDWHGIEPKWVQG